MNEKIREILSPAYNPCEGFDGECKGEMRWDPSKGHAPRGFCGAEGKLEDVEVIFVFAEPGDPLAEESHSSIEEAISCARDFFEKGIDVMHKNVRLVMDLCWPGMTCDEQMKKCLFTDSVLCSAVVESGPISREIEKECVKRYFLPILKLVPNAKVIAFGNKAQKRLANGGYTDYIAARAVAPPEGNKPQARESWIKAVSVLRGEAGRPAQDQDNRPTSQQAEEMENKDKGSKKTNVLRDMKGHKYVKTREEAIESLKKGSFIDAKKISPFDFKKKDIFPLFLELLTEAPAEYPVNYISFLNCSGSGEWQSFIPGAMSGGKQHVHDYCKDNYETLILYKKHGQIYIKEGKKTKDLV